MKKVWLMVVILLFISVAYILADDEPLNIPTAEDNYIENGSVEKSNDQDTLEAGTVEKVEKPTAEPTVAQKPKPKPKPKPTPKPVKKYKPSPKPVPTPTPAPVVSPDFKVANITTESLVKDKTTENLYGLIYTGERIRVQFDLQNTGGSAYGATAELTTNHPKIVMINAKKDLQDMAQGQSKEVSFVLDVLNGYNGPQPLPVSLKVKSQNFEKDYPLEIYVEMKNPYILYGIIFFILIIIITIISRLASGGKKVERYH